MMFIARIYVEKGLDSVYEHIVSNYEDLKTPEITPLYVTKAISNGETSLIVEAKDTTTIANFVLQHFSKMDTVRDIDIVNLMRPVFFPLPHDVEGYKRYTVALQCRPGNCEEIYDSLTKLEPSEDAFLTYVAFTFLKKGHDLLASVMARDMHSLERFVGSSISSLEGVTNVKVTQITKTQKLATMFEWKKTVHPLTVWENLTSRDWPEDVYRDVIAGC